MVGRQLQPELARRRNAGLQSNAPFPFATPTSSEKPVTLRPAHAATANHPRPPSIKRMSGSAASAVRRQLAPSALVHHQPMSPGVMSRIQELAVIPCGAVRSTTQATIASPCRRDAKALRCRQRLQPQRLAQALIRAA